MDPKGPAVEDVSEGKKKKGSPDASKLATSMVYTH